MTKIATIESTPRNDPGHFYRLWKRGDEVPGDEASAFIEWWYERAERRTRLLRYVRDIRNLLQPLGTYADGPSAQAYRDRWSCLCRQLCEDGKPVLHDASAYRNSIPDEVFI